MIDSRNFFTHYVGNVPQNFVDKVGNFFLTPFDIAVGREVKVTLIQSKKVDNQIIDKFLVLQKDSSYAMRFVAGVIAALAFPFTFIGCLLRATSATHRDLIGKENTYYLRKKSVKQEKPHKESSQKASKIVHNSPNLPNPEENTKYLHQIQSLAKLAQTIDSTIEKHKNKKSEKDLLKHLVKKFISTLSTVAFENKTKGKQITQSFRDHVTYEELLLLKRSLSALQYHQENTSHSFLSEITDYHQMIRKLYYEKFPIEHMVRNLKEKQAIPAVERAAHLVRVDFGKKISHKALDAAQESLHETHPDQIKWLHGTSSATVVALAATDRKLKPRGQLKSEHRVSFTGEHASCCPITDDHVSGTDLDHANIAINYAKGVGAGISDQVGIECSRDPKKQIDLYKEKLEKILKDITSPNESKKEAVAVLFKKYLDTGVDCSQDLDNFHRHMKILLNLEPTLFEKKLYPLISEIKSKLKNLEKTEGETQVARRAQNLRQRVFSPILKFKSTLTPGNEEDEMILREMYPVVFGSATMIISLASKSDDAQRKVACSVDSNGMEYAYKGSLTLGTDLKYVFVPNNKVQITREYLKKKNIRDMKVYNLETLKIASVYNVFLFKTLQINKKRNKNPISKISVS